jgi:CHASE2 domain-containing sensor protein/signal transduction histidine kinase
MSIVGGKRLRGVYVIGVKPRVLIEWLLIVGTAIGLLLVLVLTGSTDRFDWIVYDMSIAQLRDRPRADIIVVSIDDKSLRELGRWPWSRSLHAKLLRNLAHASPRAILYDVQFSEPTDEDKTLADAMRLTPTYLPVVMTGQSDGNSDLPDAILPVDVVASATAGLGFINMTSDSDGVLRRVYLGVEAAGRRWPQFVVPLYLKERKTLHAASGDRQFASAGPVHHDRTRAITDRGDAGSVLVPFTRASYRVKVVSFSAVLRDEVPAEFFRNQIVLVGATAPGLSDHFATPNTEKNSEMPGVFIHVGVLSALLNHTMIEPGGVVGVISLAIVMLCVLVVALLTLAPVHVLTVLLLLIAIAAASSEAMLGFGRTWISPVPAIIVLLYTYFFWSWRRLALMMSWLVDELKLLSREPHIFQDPEHVQQPGGDVLARHIDSIRRAAQRQREMRRFIWNTLNGLPHPVLIADSEMQAIFFNTTAHRCLFQAKRLVSGSQSDLVSILGAMKFVRAVHSKEGSDSEVHWPDVLDSRVPANALVMTRGVEITDSNERHYLLRYTFAASDEGSPAVWIATLVDITEMLSAQRQRDELLSFLSHDMRAPLGSVLALLTASREGSGSGPDEGTVQHIERHVHRTLDLADNFVRLAHATSHTYAFQTLSLGEIVLDACDEIWALAQEKRIRIECQVDEEGECWVFADGSLMKRVLVNVINNAIKYSHAGTEVKCSVRAVAEPRGFVRCVVEDHGFGIDPRHLPYLFERFRRFRSPGQPPADGIGLGLAFVKTVISRHRGTISVQSSLGVGTTFTITLPAAQENPPQDSFDVEVSKENYA